MGAVRGACPQHGGRRLTEPVAGTFVVAARTGTPRQLLTTESASVATAVVCRPTSGALVLGSTQSEAGVDVDLCSAAGLDVCRRRSGGGAVVVRPGAQTWVDVFIPRGDRRFDDDVVASFGFLGAAWRAALILILGPPPASVAVVPAPAGVTTRWSRVVCFAGLGAGEVTLDGRKVVGISQRRHRAGAWFHSMAMLEFDPFELPKLLGLPEADRLDATASLADTAAAVPGGADLADELAAAVLAQLT